MIVIVDNFDSFTYNLEQRLGEIDPSLEIQVYRNDEITVEAISELRPSHLILSPGPCTPNEAGISVACVQHFHGKLPLLGVCLGHQSIGQATGAKIVSADELKHVKTDQIHHYGKGLFQGVPNPMTATRYHSLVIEPSTLSAEFEVTAWVTGSTGANVIMGIQHRTAPTFGVQFHPESFLTDRGIDLLHNFLKVNRPNKAVATPA